MATTFFLWLGKMHTKHWLTIIYTKETYYIYRTLNNIVFEMMSWYKYKLRHERRQSKQIITINLCI